ncbi:flagellar hook-basal body complex subunit FliE [Spirochaeta thermophila DSM 6578]|uniref:Flagellar hook-basal body complex protein FliE n=1 Tax=Winmispira thermophila (strain ATCC 700085 / DSM 6578 / Z-1203) TaxID=869211 RepID=G0GCC3_WINT7|nr:flagellar hook-basal body complex protein FliE [Spirochaeta thermophila]AEJ61208.1 flagellar hook-basal body complex subunit FliE [Spirochaeta thermophila DSM 6578]
MQFLTETAAVGHKITLQKADPRHFQGHKPEEKPVDPDDFSRLLFEALDGVNSLQQKSALLSQQMITDPDSLDPHDVTIAMAKANLALSITKSVVDRAVQAYREILSLR